MDYGSHVRGIIVKEVKLQDSCGVDQLYSKVL